MQKDSFIPRIKIDDDYKTGDSLHLRDDVKAESKDKGNFENGSILLPNITPKIPTLNDTDEKIIEQRSKISNSMKRGLNRKGGFFRGKALFIILGLLIVFLVLAGLVMNVVLKGRKVYEASKKLKESIKTQDFAKVKTELGNFEQSYKKLNSAYKLVAWLRFVPFAGAYVADGSHLLTAGEFGLGTADVVIDTIEPYADLIGFSSDKVVSDGEKTASDRIDFVVKTLPLIIPKVDDIVQGSNKIKSEIDKIDPTRYPVKFRGYEVRANIEKYQTLVDETTEFVGNSKPLLENAPYLLGIDQPRTYLLLFQNDKELRPTGGFLTAYSIMEVDKAKFSPVRSDDIYHLDAKYQPVVIAPQPIVKYIKGPYVLNKNFRLRDMNWSPDFADSMKLFLTEAESVGIEDIDGIVAVDTQALVYILDVLGPIGVPGFGDFSTKIVPECNCPQVIYELESFADVEGPVVWDPAGTGKIIYQPKNADNRKKIIGPLMNSVFANAMGQPKEKMGALFEAGFKSLTEKHILLYMLDEKVQSAVSDFGIGGRMLDGKEDYISIVDANLGGRKSNLYVTQEVNQEYIVSKDGSIEKTLTITYKNPEKQDGWLNSVLPNWVRIYVPKGSQFVSAEGLDDKSEPYEEFNKTVFSGYFELRPQGVVKVLIKYKLSFKAEDKLDLFIQKQAGVANPLYTFRVGKTEEEFYLKTDKHLQFKI